MKGSLCLPCQGVQEITPLSTYNHPGLDALRYRIGTHASFLETMLARLTRLGINVTLDRETGKLVGPPIFPLLNKLNARTSDDPGIALLDSWATIADVLTFYQERLANEGFLRTAQERRSVHELSRLVGYTPRPGLSASVYLAFEVEAPNAAPFPIPGQPAPAQDVDVLIPKGTQAKSTPVPGSGDKPQTFETVEELIARPEWNALIPRQTVATSLRTEDLLELKELYFEGTGLKLKQSDWFAIDSDAASLPTMRQAELIDEQPENKRTRVQFRRDPLDATQLIDDLIKLIETCLITLEQQGANLQILPPATFYRDLNLRLTSFISEARLNRSRWRLEGTDRECLLLARDLHVANSVANPRSVVWGKISGDIVKWATTAVALLNDTATVVDGNNVPSVLGTRPLVATLKQLHEDHYTSAAKGKDAIAALQSGPRAITSQTSVEEALADIKTALWASTDFATANSPGCVFGLSSHAAGANQQLNGFARVLSPLTTQVTVRFTRIAGVNGTATPLNTVVNNNAQPVTESMLSSALSGLTVSSITPGIPRVFRVNVLDNSPTPALLGTSIVVVLVAGDVPVFSKLVTQRSIVFTNTDAQVLDRDIALVPNGAPEVPAAYSVVLNSAFRNVSSFSFAQSPTPEGFIIAGNVMRQNIAADMSTPSQLTNALRQLRVALKPGTTHDSIYIIIRIGGTRVSAAVRDIVVEAVSPPLREVLGDLHEVLAAPAPLMSDVVDELAKISPTLDYLKSVADSIPLEANLSEATELRDLAIQNEPDADQRSLLLLKRAQFVSETNRFDDQLKRALYASGSPTGGIVDIALSEFRTNISALAVPLANLTGLPQTFEGRLDPAGAGGPATIPEAIRQMGSSLSLKSHSKIVDDLRLALRVLAEKHLADAVALDKAIAALRGGILGKISTRRSDLANRVSQMSAGYTGPSLAKARIERLIAYINSKATLERMTVEELATATSFKILLDQIVIEAGESIQLAPAPFEPPPTIDSLIGADASGTTILGNWTRLAKQLREVTDPVNSSLNNVARLDFAGLVSQLRGGARLGEAALALQLGTLQLSAQLFAHLSEQERGRLKEIIRSVRVRIPQHSPRVFVFRNTARVFGWNSVDMSPVSGELLRDQVASDPTSKVDCLADAPANKDKRASFVSIVNGWLARAFGITIANAPAGTTEYDSEEVDRVFLDGAFEKIRHDGVVAFDLAMPQVAEPIVRRVIDVSIHPRSKYGVRNDATRIVVGPQWWKASASDQSVIRTTRVLCESEQLQVAEEPYDAVLPGRKRTSSSLSEKSNEILCDAPAFDLQVGKRVAIDGPRLSADSQSEVPHQQIVEIANIEQTVEPTLAGDRYVTRLTFVDAVEGPYVRAKTRISANLVEATHGEAQREVLGSGNGAREYQTFTLKSPPLTRVPALSASGEEPELKVRVNSVEWTRVESLHSVNEQAHSYAVITCPDQRTAIVFGKDGSRLPTGVENVQAVYRYGMGLAGNVDAGRIDQLSNPPRGVKSVKNPLRASGGADRESRLLAKERAPIRALGVDRLVSVKDYENYANLYAGISQASAELFANTIHLTVAGSEPRPLDRASRMFLTFQSSLKAFGDPNQAFAVFPHDLMLLIISAQVRIDAKYLWSDVESRLSQSLYEAFSFDRARFAKDLLQSDAIEVMQRVRGVVYVDINKFDAVIQDASGQSLQMASTADATCPQSAAPSQSPSDQLLTPALSPRVEVRRGHFDRCSGRFVPSQLCYLAPDVPDTLFLEQLS